MKRKCRTYSYFCPTVCFSTSWYNHSLKFWPFSWFRSTQRKHYRITDEHLTFVRSLLAEYIGTKSYHNFTSRTRLGDPSAKRHILSFEVIGSPFVYSGWEYIELRVKGQSFMKHQIRKMVGLAIVRAGGHWLVYAIIYSL